MGRGKALKKEALVYPVDLSRITEVIRDKCITIRRPKLEDVVGSEVKIKSFIQDTETYVCRIRGMTYAVCVNKQHPSMGTFDPRPTGESPGRVIRGHSNDRVDDR
ncbi:MAG: hypothetical protein KBC35_01080 [Candidatus Pacebacteria bacterium]|nr:hypothetical protein [Candidatus Paceibacterota bacterium]